MRKAILRSALVLTFVCIGFVVTSFAQQCARDDSGCLIAYYTQMIKANPENAEAYYNRAVMYRDTSQYSLAIADLNKYVSLNIPDKGSLADGYRVRAWVKHKSGDDKGAFDDIDKAFNVNPAETEGFYMRGMIYNAQQAFPSAITHLTNYIDINAARPEFLADGLYQRGFAYNGSGKFDLAIKDLTEAIGLNPGKGVFYKERAYGYRKLGKTALAAADEAKARDLQ